MAKMAFLIAAVLYWMGDASQDEVEYVLARVGVVDSSGETVAYLNFPDSDEMSALAVNDGTFKTDVGFADLGKYSSNEYGFFVEVMNYGDKFNPGNPELYVTGTSYASSYQDLVSAGYVYGSPLELPTLAQAWAPVVHIPEPSSGMLILLGIAILAIRRATEQI